MLKKTDGTPTAHKSLPVLDFKVTDEDQGICVELVAGIGNIDAGQDMIVPGAFSKTISERGPQRFRVLDSHQTDSALRVVGKCLSAREVRREAIPPEIIKQFPDLTGALQVETQYLLDTPEGLGVFKRKKSGALSEMSIGYDALDTEWVTVKAKKTGEGYQLDPDGADMRVRKLKQIRLWEYSPVVFGMNAATSTTGVKTGEAEPVEDKAAVPYQNLPLADRNHAWSGGGARQRVADWAGGNDNLDYAKYKRAFLWYDPDKADTQGGYKYPVADVIDGKLTAVPKGIFAAAASLQGGRTNTTIPEADQSAMKTHLGKYYAKMASTFDDDSIVAPWDKAKKSFSLTDLIEDICEAFCSQYPNTYVREVWSDYVIAASFRYGDMECQYWQVGFTFDTDGTPVFDPPSKWVSGKYVFQADTAMGQSEPATEGEGESGDEMDQTESGMTAAADRAHLLKLYNQVNTAMSQLSVALSKAGVLPPVSTEPAPVAKVGPEPPPTTEIARLKLLAELNTEAM